MTDALGPGRSAPPRALPGLAYVRGRAHALLHVLVAVWIFSGGFVMMEPSPYELMFVFVLTVSLFSEMGLHRGTLGLFLLVAFFTPFALIGAFQGAYIPLTQAVLFVFITIFMMLTAYFLANYLADAPRERLSNVMRAYSATAVLSTVIGVLSYLHIMPGAELFLLYGRAKAAFQDPNVFGPFLILPAMFALQRLLLLSGRRAIWSGVLFATLFVGVFVSFSRAAWGSILFASMLTFLLCFALEANARQKVRMMVLGSAGAAFLVVALAGLISIPSVHSLFEERASITQSYDTGTTGRFGRQGYAFELALEHPWGIGPLEFSKLRISELPHDTYVNVLHGYGWGGGLVFWVLLAMTLWRGFKALGIRSENRLLLIPVLSTYIPLVAEAGIIDIDHWRHLYLLIGLIWGVTADYMRVSPQHNGAEPALP